MQVLYKAVYSTIKGTLLRRPMMQKLHLFPDDASAFFFFDMSHRKTFTLS